MEEAYSVGPHDPSPDQDWQESMYLTWWDAITGVGGMHRFGHNPARGKGAFWLGCVTRDGRRFARWNDDVPMRSEDRQPGRFVIGDVYRVEATEKGLSWRVAQEGLSIDLEAIDFHPMADVFAPATLTDAASPSALSAMYSRHYETQGKVRGTITLGGRTQEIDGLFHRNQSWGPRNWGSGRVYRVVAGTAGTALSYTLATFMGEDGQVQRRGCVVRNGIVTLATSIDVTVEVEPDGFTYRGGRAVWLLPDEPPISMDMRAVDAMLFGHGPLIVPHALVEMETSAGPGFAFFGATHNARGGTGPLPLAIGAATTDGFSLRPARIMG